MQIELWQKMTALHDRIDIRLFDEEWDKRRVRHKPKTPQMIQCEGWWELLRAATYEQEMARSQYLAGLQDQQRYYQAGLGGALGGMAQQIFGSNWYHPGTMQKCPYCGR